MCHTSPSLWAHSPILILLQVLKCQAGCKTESSSPLRNPQLSPLAPHWLYQWHLAGIWMLSLQPWATVSYLELSLHPRALWTRFAALKKVLESRLRVGREGWGHPSCLPLSPSSWLVAAVLHDVELSMVLITAQSCSLMPLEAREALS